MAMQTAGPKGLSAEMNVAPTIDILSVLLIIFMILTPLAPEGENALIPQPDPNPKAKAVPDPRTLVLEVLDKPGGQHPLLRLNQQGSPGRSCTTASSTS